MTNQALPQKSRQMLENHIHRCQNLGLILDKYAPWGVDGRGNWDLTIRSTVRRQNQNQIQTLSGGEAKGLWLSTSRKAAKGESPSLFENLYADTNLIHANLARWKNTIRANDGIAFTMKTAERLIAGLGASHVLETALTLERNTGLPYLPGSTVKGLARAWGIIEIAAQLEISLDETIKNGKEEQHLLNILSEILISEPNESLYQTVDSLRSFSTDTDAFIDWFRFIFGWQGEAGAICFTDAKYAGNDIPKYASDVMTPHYVNYYTENGSKPPSEDDNPNPVSFIAVDEGNTFAFGLIPRLSAFAIFEEQDQDTKLTTALDVTQEWLIKALTQLGIGSKTTAGYGFFSRKSRQSVIER